MIQYNRVTCFICGDNNLKLLFSLKTRGVSHYEEGHNYVYDYETIAICTNCGHAQIELYSHDCFPYHEDEDWDMWWWYVLDKASTNTLLDLIRNCPNPLDSFCNCSLHKNLQDSSERIYGKIRHATDPNDKVQATSITLELKEGKPSIKQAG